MIDRSRLDDAWHRQDAIDHLLVVHRRASNPVGTTVRWLQLEREHVFRRKAGIDTLQRDERSDHQRGANPQHESERHLTDDEHVQRPASCACFALRAEAQQRLKVRPNGKQRWQGAEGKH